SEPLVAAWGVGDVALERSRRAQLGAVRSQGDELRHVPCAAVARALELAQEPRDAILRPPCGVDARPSAERGGLDARVLSDDPGVRRGVRAPVARLDPSVLDKGLAVFGRLVL